MLLFPLLTWTLDFRPNASTYIKQNHGFSFLDIIDKLIQYKHKGIFIILCLI